MLNPSQKSVFAVVVDAKSKDLWQQSGQKLAVAKASIILNSHDNIGINSGLSFDHIKHSNIAMIRCKSAYIKSGRR